MLNTEEIIQAILANPADRDKAVIKIAKQAKLKNDIMAYVKRNSGEEHDGHSVFNDSIIVFVKKIVANREIELHQGVEAYLFGIAKRVWSNKRRTKLKHRSEELEAHRSIPSDEDNLLNLMTEERKEQLSTLLTEIGDKCRQVLMLWSYSYAMKEIAAKLGYASEGMARKKKHQCLQKLKSIILSNPSLQLQLKV